MRVFPGGLPLHYELCVPPSPPHVCVSHPFSDTHTYTLTLSMFEIYNETVRDLVAEDADPRVKHTLEIRRGAEGTFIDGLTKRDIGTAADMDAFVSTGFARRSVGSTSMNETSSRSHMVVMVEVGAVEVVGGRATRSKMFLIDLAGSERFAFDKSAERAREAQVRPRAVCYCG